MNWSQVGNEVRCNKDHTTGRPSQKREVCQPHHSMVKTAANHTHPTVTSGQGWSVHTEPAPSSGKHTAGLGREPHPSNQVKDRGTELRRIGKQTGAKCQRLGVHAPALLIFSFLTSFFSIASMVSSLRPAQTGNNNEAARQRSHMGLVRQQRGRRNRIHA